MAIVTRIAPMYGGQKLFAAVLCLVFGLWGVYDLFQLIPSREQRFAQYQSLKAERETLVKKKAALRPGLEVAPEDATRFEAIEAEMKQLSPDGAELTKPGTFDRIVQWVYISCLPFAPYFFWAFSKAKRQKYTLGDDGSLTFAGDAQHGGGTWAQDQIADIDMERWMMKSIAHVVHTNGTRLKLDAYLHKHLDLIVGAIASRLHPEAWTADAKPVKKDADGEPDSIPNDSTDEQAETAPN